MRRSIVTLITICFGFVTLAPVVLADTHYAIMVPLMTKEPKDINDIDLNKNIAYIDVTTIAPLPFKISVFPTWTAPPFLPDIPVTNNGFGSSLSVIPNLLTHSGASHALVRVQRDTTSSEATLNISSGKDSIKTLIPSIDIAKGVGFVFPIGDPGTRATLYMGNPDGVTATVRIRYGASTNPVSAVHSVRSFSTTAIPIETAYSRVVAASDLPVIAMLEIVTEKGKIIRTILFPS